MKTVAERIALMLVLMVVLMRFVSAGLRVSLAEDSGIKIDVFTQNEPYSGRGPNQPSDAFCPQENVVLNALVTYGESALQNVLVVFEVLAPDNTSFCLTDSTNDSGIATVHFTIPYGCANTTDSFGSWFIRANASIAGKIVRDTLTFVMDWVVKLISVRTIDESLTYRSSFGKGGKVGLEIALRSVAMSIKLATLTIVVEDTEAVPISCFTISDFAVQPNEKLIILYCSLPIPKWAFAGMATVFVDALISSADENGVAYCPEVSTDFLITIDNPLEVHFYDATVVSVDLSSRSVELGQSASISAIVRNEGTEIINFSVEAYLDEILIGVSEVVELSPYSKSALSFNLNSSLFEVGNHTVTVSIPQLANEADITDNSVSSTIEIEQKMPTIVHNVAIIAVKVSYNLIYVGELLSINVSVLNKGTEIETFLVRVYYDSSLIDALLVNALEPNTQTTLFFVWNTSSINKGFYEISASAPLLEDIDVSDNTFIDGIVQVKTRPAPPPPLVHDVAILHVSPSSSLVYRGDIVNVSVVVRNLGDYVESFSVALFYDSHVIETLNVADLASKTEITLVFRWSTQGVSEGNYTLSASASIVQGEVNVANNSFVDGVVEVVKGAAAGWFIPDWFYLLLLILLLIIIILLALLLCYRKRRKKFDEAFYSGWTAWYYCCDLQRRVRNA